MKKNFTLPTAQQDRATVLKFQAAHFARALQLDWSYWLRRLPQGLRGSLDAILSTVRSSLTIHPARGVTLQSLSSQQKRYGLGQWIQWLGLLGVSVSALAENPHRPFTRLPYLQGSSPTQIHVLWRTEGPIQPVVRWGTQPDRLDQTVPLAAIVTRASLGTNGQPMLPQWLSLRTPENLSLPKLHSAPIGTFQYEAAIEGLSPDTVYYYGVFNGSERLTAESPEQRFQTQPQPGTVRPYRFWVLGDSGTGREAQRAVHEGMQAWVKQDGRPLDFWIHVGDMAYGTGRDVEFQSRFFESYQTTLRNSVCWPAMGNHEGHTSKGSTGIGPYYDAYWVPTRAESGGLASGTEAYYSFDHGNIHFICLDSHDLDRKPSGAMAKWLKADLEKAKAEWLIAFWHHPPYTKGSHDSDKEADLIEVRHHLLPILESGGVDLVLTGHSHIYERSMLMDGAYSTNATVAENFILDDGDGDPRGDGAYRKGAGLRPHEGAVQVVAGHSGASLGRVGTSPVMRRTLVEHGSLLVDVEGETLVGRMINREGVERDRFSLVKRGTPLVRRLSLPWQPPEYKAPEKATKSPYPPPLDHAVLIPAGAEWRALSGAHPQGSLWTQPGFDDSSWLLAKAPFNSGRGRLLGEGRASKEGRPSLYVRRQFTVTQADAVTELGLWVDYADAIIVYLNGQEVTRVNVGRSSGRNAQGIKLREDSGAVYVPLGSIARFLVDGVNVLAIECHAHSEGSIDFGLNPALWMED